MKKFLSAVLLTFMAIPAVAMAEGAISGSEIDLDSIRYNKNNNTSEIRMKIYNENYSVGGNEMFYAMYYLKMDCSKKTYKPMMIEGYSKRDELMLVDYEPRAMQPVANGSDLEQAYNYACKIVPIPQVDKKNK